MADEFVYVKAVPGHAVRRFGTPVHIGAERVKGVGFVWTEGEVVALPAAHWARYRKEYSRAVGDGALEMATEADYKKWVKAQARRSAKDAQPSTDAPAADGRTR